MDTDLIHREVLADAVRLLASASRDLHKVTRGSNALVTPADAKNISIARAKINAALARIPDQDVIESRVKEMP